MAIKEMLQDEGFYSAGLMRVAPEQAEFCDSRLLIKLDGPHTTYWLRVEAMGKPSGNNPQGRAPYQVVLESLDKFDDLDEYYFDDLPRFGTLREADAWCEQEAADLMS